MHTGSGAAAYHIIVDLWLVGDQAYTSKSLA